MDVMDISSEEDQPVYDSLLFIALEDLDSSIILYHREHYPQSVFYLQQAVEKAVKSLGLLFEIVSERDLFRRVGHKPLEIYRRPISKISTDLPALNKELDNHPEFRDLLKISGIDFDELASSTKNLVHQFDEYLSTVVDYNLSSEVFSEIISMIGQVNREIETAEEKIRGEGIREEEFDAIQDDLRKQFEALFISIHIPSPQKEAMRDELNSFFTSFFPNKEFFEYLVYVLLKIVRIAQNLFYLSIITSPHATKSRYPEDNFNPLEFYTPGSLLMNKLPELQGITRHTLEEMDGLYDLIFDLLDDAPGVSKDAGLILSPGEESNE